MNHQPAHLLARMALLVTLSLTAACATVDTTSVEDKGGPQAPGPGYDAATLAPGAARTATSPPSASPATQSAEAAATSFRTPVPGQITRRQKYVNIRPEPSTNKKPVAVLTGGKKVEIIDRQELWLKIRWTRGKKMLEGWVAGKYVDAPE